MGISITLKRNVEISCQLAPGLLLKRLYKNIYGLANKEF